MTNNKTNLMFMAFSGRDNSTPSFSRYSGVGAVKILAINPTREEWNDIFGGSLTTPISYTGTKIVDGKTVETAWVTFITQVDDLKAPNIKATIPISFFIENRYHVTSKGTYEVIDKYGRTAYGDKETITKKKPIMYGDFKAKIDELSYRPALVGEASLISFIKAFRNILEVETYDGDRKVFVEEKDEKILATRVAMFDNPKAMFSGDFTEVKAAINEYPNNKVKVMFGVRHRDNGDAQDFFTGYFMRSGQNSLAPMVKNVNDAKSAGRYPNTDFDLSVIHIWEPKTTNFDEAPKTFDVSKPTDIPSKSEIDKQDDEVDDLPFDNNWGL